MSTDNVIDGYHLFASSTAALVARTITHPMDTIKIRLQATTIQYSNARTLLKQLPNIIFPVQQQQQHGAHGNKTKRIVSLYRGLPVALLFSVPALSVYLSCYESTKQALHTNYHIQPDAVTSHLISGCAAEFAAGLLFTPMEVMKNRLQTTTTTAKAMTRQQTSFRSLAKHIFRHEGVRGFFKGYWMSLVVFVPHSMTYFVTYERMKRWMIRDESRTKPTLYMVCSSVAGIASCLVSTPLDIIKTRWQISAAEQGSEFRQGPLAIAKKMLRLEGRQVLIRALCANIAWGLPTTAISMTVFEVLKNNKSRFI
ncbi:MAG: mitochondrial carrier domain-containing protein [Benjaminiella poitrasii]|nr:MAG: mitochondrial carrier domain-containing protein [Benjaminiella poitrasii]